MKLGDRIWLWRNKKPPTRHARYWASAFLWIFTGLMFSAAVQNGCVLVGSVKAGSEYVGSWAALFGITLGLFVLMCLAIYFTDRKQGYIDAVHRHHLSRWQEKRGKILGR